MVSFPQASPPKPCADNLTTFMCWLSWNLRILTSWKPQGLSRYYCAILMGSVASPLKVTTEFWQYLHSAMPRISNISITLYQMNVTLDARWSHLNKKIVKLCSLDFTDLAKWITNDTLAFEWGGKTWYWMNKESTCRFSTYSGRVRNKFVSFLSLKEKITIFNVVLQSHSMKRDGSVGIVTGLWTERTKNRGTFPLLEKKKDLSFFRRFQAISGSRPASKNVREPLPWNKGIEVWGWTPTFF
jgi:hypothetical protein